MLPLLPVLLPLLLLLSLLLLPLPSSQAAIVSKFAPGGQYIMITFENGPHEQHTPVILDALKAHKNRATFFIHGEKVQSHAGLIKRMAMEGHEIGISSIDSRSYSEIPNEELAAKLAAVTSQLSNITGLEASKFKHVRPPNGERNLKKYEEISKMSGKDIVLTTLDAKDWEGPAAEVLVSKNIMPYVKPGEVVALRDTLEVTAKAATLLLDELAKGFYELLTIAEVRSFPDDTPK